MIFKKKSKKMIFFSKKFQKKIHCYEGFFLCQILMNIKIPWLKITICGKKVNNHVTKCYFNREKIKTIKNAQKVDFCSYFGVYTKKSPRNSKTTKCICFRLMLDPLFLFLQAFLRLLVFFLKR